MGKQDEDRDGTALRALEETLRRMSAPEPPAGLEERLVAAIPRTRAPRTVRARTLVTVAVAAAVLIAFAVGLAFLGGEAHKARPVGPPVLGDTSAQRVLPAAGRDILMETNPCDILPPLSFS